MVPAASLFLLAALLAGGGDLPDHVLRLSRIRAKMRVALETLPNYTCLAVTERSRQTARDRVPKRLDTVRVEVAHADNRDLLAWPGARRFEASDPAQLVRTGMFSSGEYFSHLAGIFGQAAVLRYVGPEAVAGRNLLRWDYALARSIAGNWMVTWAGRTEIAGEKGSFWADPETSEVLRVTAISDDLPPDFAIREVRTTIDYARVRIAGRDVYLPQTALVMVNESSGERSMNTIEFSHCRQFLTSSDIRYGVDEMAATTVTADSGIREIVIPAGLRLTLELAGDVDPGMAIGDRIQAVVASDVVHRRQVVIPKDAVVTGRVRRVELDSESSTPRYILGLEFGDIDFPGHHARFLARLQRIEGVRMRPGEVPGVTTLVLDTEPFRIANGTTMIWVTEDISR